MTLSDQELRRSCPRCKSVHTFVRRAKCRGRFADAERMCYVCKLVFWTNESEEPRV